MITKGHMTMHLWNRLCFDSQMNANFCNHKWTVIILAKIYIEIRNIDLVWHSVQIHVIIITLTRVLTLWFYPTILQDINPQFVIKSSWLRGLKRCFTSRGMAWVRILQETYIFILNFSIPACSEQLCGSHANEIKHDHSPEVIVVLDPDTIYHTRPCIFI